MTGAREERRRAASVLLVGVGGLGSPAAMVLARAGVGRIGIADADVVEESNLHRQILFEDSDVGRPKIVAAREAILRHAPDADVTVHATRLLPENAAELVAGYDLVVEGSDNFATKFLTADACRLAKKPVVHGAAVRWHGTALAVSSEGCPCYRCLFEDLPEGDAADTCAAAGVMGPVVGLVGAIQADLALAILDGGTPFGTLVTVDRAHVRSRVVAPRRGCALCGARTIRDTARERYVADSM